MSRDEEEVTEWRGIIVSPEFYWMTDIPGTILGGIIILLLIGIYFLYKTLGIIFWLLLLILVVIGIFILIARNWEGIKEHKLAVMNLLIFFGTLFLSAYLAGVYGDFMIFSGSMIAAICFLAIVNFRMLSRKEVNRTQQSSKIRTQKRPMEGKLSKIVDREELDSEFNNPETWKNKGNELFAKGDYKSALKCYRQAIEIDPDYVSGWNNYGLTLLKLGRIDEATEVKKKTEELRKIQSTHTTFSALQDLRP